jgi:hypothetical protein
MYIVYIFTEKSHKEIIMYEKTENAKIPEKRLKNIPRPMKILLENSRL